MSSKKANDPIPVGKRIAYLLFDDNCIEYWASSKIEGRWPDSWDVICVKLYADGRAMMHRKYEIERRTKGEAVANDEFVKALTEAFRRLGLSGQPVFNPFNPDAHD